MRLCTLLLLALFTYGAEEVGELNLRDIQGGSKSVRPGASRATVVVFVSAVCPMSVEYADRLVSLDKIYSAQGMNLLLVNSNANESDPEVEQQRKAAGLPFPIYRDPDGQVAQALNARATPTAVVIDSGGLVRYSGRIDDARNPAKVKQQYLRLAIEAVVRGNPVVISRTRVLGCTIKSL